MQREMQAELAAQHNYPNQVSLNMDSNVMGLNNMNGIPMGMDMGYPMHNTMTSYLHYGNKKSDGLRKGKWTVEEERYTNKIIEAFNAGTIDLPESSSGITLRAYLAEKLGCDPMRITKKYTGTSCLGKRVYHCDVCKASPEVVTRVKNELKELEQKFKEKLEQTTREKRESELSVAEFQNHIISTPAIDAMLHNTWGYNVMQNPTMNMGYPMQYMQTPFQQPVTNGTVSSPRGTSTVPMMSAGGISTTSSTDFNYAAAAAASQMYGNPNIETLKQMYPPVNHDAYMFPQFVNPSTLPMNPYTYGMNPQFQNQYLAAQLAASTMQPNNMMVDTMYQQQLQQQLQLQQVQVQQQQQQQQQQNSLNMPMLAHTSSEGNTSGDRSDDDVISSSSGSNTTHIHMNNHTNNNNSNNKPHHHHHHHSSSLTISSSTSPEQKSSASSACGDYADMTSSESCGSVSSNCDEGSSSGLHGTNNDCNNNNNNNNNHSKNDSEDNNNNNNNNSHNYYHKNKGHSYPKELTYSGLNSVSLDSSMKFTSNNNNNNMKNRSTNNNSSIDNNSNNANFSNPSMSAHPSMLSSLSMDYSDELKYRNNVRRTGSTTDFNLSQMMDPMSLSLDPNNPNKTLQQLSGVPPMSLMSMWGHPMLPAVPPHPYYAAAMSLPTKLNTPTARSNVTVSPTANMMNTTGMLPSTNTSVSSSTSGLKKRRLSMNNLNSMSNSSNGSPTSASSSPKSSFSNVASKKQMYPTNTNINMSINTADFPPAPMTVHITPPMIPTVNSNTSNTTTTTTTTTSTAASINISPSLMIPSTNNVTSSLVNGEQVTIKISPKNSPSRTSTAAVASMDSPNKPSNNNNNSSNSNIEVRSFSRQNTPPISPSKLSSATTTTTTTTTTTCEVKSSSSSSSLGGDQQQIVIKSEELPSLIGTTTTTAATATTTTITNNANNQESSSSTNKPPVAEDHDAASSLLGFFQQVHQSTTTTTTTACTTPTAESTEIKLEI